MRRATEVVVANVTHPFFFSTFRCAAQAFSLFEEFDKQKKGWLTKEELTTEMASMDFTPAEVAQIWAKIDVHSTGPFLRSSLHSGCLPPSHPLSGFVVCLQAK